MTGYIGKTTNGFGDSVGGAAQDEREDMLGPMPGKVVAYHPEKGTVDVQPLFKKWVPSAQKSIDYPVLTDVPIDHHRSGNSGLTFPVPVGTRVMLTPMMQSSENYETDDDGDPSDRRSFNLSDMRASIAGGNSLSDPMPNVDADNTHLRFDAEGKYGMRGSPDGKVKIDGSEGNIYDLIATVVELLGTEPDLVHRTQYAEIGAKLRAMAL